jgi:hypothetical protein
MAQSATALRRAHQERAISSIVVLVSMLPSVPAAARQRRPRFFTTLVGIAPE